MKDIIYWIWLSLCCTPDTATFANLLEKFGSAEEIYNSDIKKIGACLHPRSSDRARLADKSLDRASEICEFCEKHNVGIITYADGRYPDSLRKIPTPPVLLYYRGVLPDFSRGFYASVVGTRRLTDYGRKNAFKMAYDLASAGATVVSGMALGIDGVAHAGSLAAGMPTVAVIGSGINICYPPEHIKLAREIVKNGCILTEYAPGTAPGRYNFPARNRIISGLSSLTVVIEGSEKSGAVITARHALKQERTVYALPGNVGMKGSEATSMLLKNGARVCTCADDIIRDFADKAGTSLNPFNLKSGVRLDVLGYLREYGVAATCPSDDVFYHGKSRSSVSLSEREEVKPVADKADTMKAPISWPDGFDKKALMLYKRIPGTGDCSLDSLVGEDFPIKDVMKYLLKLEMNGFVTMLPGERVARKFK